MNIILLGTANPYRGGLATFNERFALEFQNQGHNVTIYNFTLQYPNFLFPGTSQYLEYPHEDKVKNIRKINSVNPFNWLKIGLELYNSKTDILIFRYWISFMAPCYSVIAWIAKQNKHTKIFTIVDNAISHEPKFYDIPVTKLFFSITDRFLCMSQKVKNDMKLLTSKVPVIAEHPLYDSYTPIMSKEEARKKLTLPLHEKIILFFGFIRDYKGLDILLEVMSKEEMKSRKIKLIVGGEFYSNKEKYLSLAEKLNVNNQIYWHTDFIPDESISEYFCAADAVILPYKSATQSGVTQLAYFYHTPMIATNVGGIEEMVDHNEVGLITEPSVDSILNGITKFYDENLENRMKNNIEIKKLRFSWKEFVLKVISNSK